VKRRTFITLIGGAAAWPLAARAQQPAMPVVGFVHAGSLEASARRTTAFRKGLNETGYVEGQNVAVEYHWLEGQYDRLPALMADLVRRRVAVIATPAGNFAAQAAKAATPTIPIVFGVGEDPVKLGLVTSLARPDGNATGINFFFQEVVAKRLRLLHELVPKAVRIAVLINPANAPVAETTLREVPEAARGIGLQIQVLNASTSREIESAFATLVHDRAEALFVAPRQFLRQPARPICDARNTLWDSLGPYHSRRSGSRCADELWEQYPGYVSSSGRLHRSNPQGCKARRPASLAIHQIRVCHQPANGKGARDRGAQLDPIARRRGDRMMRRREFITWFC
jgi:ABC-type uncharacterized transport system substrate-binding protein